MTAGRLPDQLHFIPKGCQLIFANRIGWNPFGIRDFQLDDLRWFSRRSTTVYRLKSLRDREELVTQPPPENALPLWLNADS